VAWLSRFASSSTSAWDFGETTESKTCPENSLLKASFAQKGEMTHLLHHVDNISQQSMQYPE
jgi:hypothetical protein